MQLLLFLDDLGPSLLGKPLLSRQACHVQEDLFRAQHITSLCKEPRASYEFSRARLTKPRPCQCERTTEASLFCRDLSREVVCPPRGVNEGPFVPRQPTCSDCIGMSVSCQTATSNVQVAPKGKAARRRLSGFVIKRLCSAQGSCSMGG
jgi:hypothetical protein